MRLIGGSWNPATISALAAIFGSLTGALASSVSTWIVQKHQGRRDLLAKRIFYREQLYSDFISESAHAMADAIQYNLQDPNNLTPAYALLSRMRLSSSTDVLASAERVIHHIIITSLARIRSPTLLPKKFSPGLPSARRTPCASSAIYAVLNLKRCTVNCNNVAAESRAGFSLHEGAQSSSLSTPSTDSSPLLETWRCIFALELNHLSQSQIWHQPCLLHEQWHRAFKWRYRLWFTLNLSRFYREMLTLFPSSSCDGRSPVKLRRSLHSLNNSCGSF